MAQSLVTDQQAATQMQDVTLSGSEPPGEGVPTEEKLTNKSNSLRRFFKLSQHHVTNGGSKRDVDMTKNGSEIVDETEMKERSHRKSTDKKDAKEEKDTENDNIVGGDANQQKQSQHRRFHLRLGNAHKYGSSSGETTQGSSTLVGNKTSLKSSLSSYWNIVFKRNRTGKKGGNASMSEVPNFGEHQPGQDLRASGSVDAIHNNRDDDDAEDAEEEANETQIREEIHTLPISEDSSEEASKS